MSQETVLVVEDNRDMRVFLHDAVLKPNGYRVMMAANGQQGLEKAVTARPDLILLDLQLPRLSGLDLLNILHQQKINIPTIVISAYGSEQMILKAFRLGAKDFLQKPFTMDEAKDAIRNALTEERLRREKENLTQALALANRRLQRQVNNWVALNDIAQAITSTREEREVFRCVMKNVNRILQVEAGSLLLLDKKAGALKFVVTLRGNAVRFSDFRLKVGQGIAGWVAQHGESLLIPDVKEDPRFYPQMDQITGFQSHSILCVPLKAKKKVIGVIEVINKQSGSESPSFTEGDKELLEMLASWVSVAVENARLNRAAAKMAAMTALGQAVAALAHHINNRLMTFSLELDKMENEETFSENDTRKMIKSARRCIQEISAVVKAMDRLDDIHTVPYAGTAKMIDIEKPLQEQLRLIETQEQ